MCSKHEVLKALERFFIIFIVLNYFRSLLSIFVRGQILDVKEGDVLFTDGKKSQVVRIKYPVKCSFIVLGSSGEECIDFDSIELLTLKKVKYSLSEEALPPRIVINPQNNVLSVYLVDGTVLVVPRRFVIDVSRTIINKNVSTLETSDIESLFKEIYLLSSGIPWDMEDFISYLDDKTIQLIFNTLLKSNAISYDMLATLIVSLGKVGMKIRKNLSTNVINEVDEISKKESIREFRWVREVDFITRFNMKQVFSKEKLDIPSFSLLSTLRNISKRVLFETKSSATQISKLLENIYKRGKLYNLLNYVSRVTLAKGLVFVDDEVIELFKSSFSSKGFSELKEDIEYFRSVKDDYIDDRIALLDGCKSVIFDELYRKGEIRFSDFIDHIDNEKVFYVINEASLRDFLIVSKALNEKLRSYLLSKVSGVIRDIVKDFIKGNIRFPFVYGDSAISEAMYNVSRSMYFVYKM